MELGARIGIGNTAEIFEAGQGRVVKLFVKGYPESSMMKEYENSRLLHGLGLPVAHSYGMVQHGERHGIIYDRVEGDSLLDSLMADPSRLESGVSALAALHRTMLACRLPEALSLKEILRQYIGRSKDLDDAHKEKLLVLLEELPEGDYFCHGDFHFGNVMAGPQGHTVIDYMNICRGHTYGDIARTVYLTEMTPVPAEAGEQTEFLLQLKKKAADLYLDQMGVTREELSGWLMVTAAARLGELRREEQAERESVLRYLQQNGLAC